MTELLALDGWKLLGLSGQALFFSRFFVQWVASERRGASTVPKAFWWFSVGGGLLLFSYAAFGIQDLVFSIGQGLGLFVYSRNLMLLRRSSSELHRSAGAD